MDRSRNADITLQYRFVIPKAFGLRHFVSERIGENIMWIYQGHDQEEGPLPGEVRVKKLNRAFLIVLGAEHDPLVVRQIILEDCLAASRLAWILVGASIRRVPAQKAVFGQVSRSEWGTG